MRGNSPVRFGKRPTEKDPSHGHLAGGLFHSPGRPGVKFRLFAVSSGLLRVRWGQGMYAGLGLARVGKGSLAAVR